jgi:hypothetical protein
MRIENPGSHRFGARDSPVLRERARAGGDARNQRMFRCSSLRLRGGTAVAPLAA